jgi:hypothetical protein
MSFSAQEIAAGFPKGYRLVVCETEQISSNHPDELGALQSILGALNPIVGEGQYPHGTQSVADAQRGPLFGGPLLSSKRVATSLCVTPTAKRSLGSILGGPLGISQ